LKLNQQAVLLQQFPTPNDLAEALSNESNPERQMVAKRAFLDSEIGAQKRLASWFLKLLFESNPEQQEGLLNSIVAVLTTENLNADFVALTKMLGLPDRVPVKSLERFNTMPESERGMHDHLSEVAKQNAEQLLADDYGLLKLLHDHGVLRKTCTGTDACDF
jgi:hypothetical protein